MNIASSNATKELAAGTSMAGVLHARTPPRPWLELDVAGLARRRELRLDLRRRERHKFLVDAPEPLVTAPQPV